MDSSAQAKLALLREKMSKARELNAQAIDEGSKDKRSKSKKSSLSGVHKRKRQNIRKNTLVALKTSAADQEYDVLKRGMQRQYQSGESSSPTKPLHESLNQYLPNHQDNVDEDAFRIQEQRLEFLANQRKSAAGGQNPSGDLGVKRLQSSLQAEEKRKHDAYFKSKSSTITGSLGSINERNRIFNMKAERSFKQQASEIQRNLERGTALPNVFK